MTYNSTPGHVEDWETDNFLADLWEVTNEYRLLVVPTTLTGTTVADLSGRSHDLTASSTVAGWLSHTSRGVTYDLDGTTNYLYCADHADFSFGDGSDDSPFSVFALAGSDNGNNTSIIVGKGDIYTGHDCEWLLELVNGKPTFTMCDASMSYCIGRQKDETVGDSIRFIVGTYDGSGSSSGVALYENGVRVDDADYEFNSYTAMHNTGESLYVGAVKFDTGLAGRWDGRLACVGVVGEELSPDQVWELSKLVRGHFGV